MVRVISIWVFILILSFIFSPSLKAEILKWVDENGTTHYSDQPSGDKDVEFVEESKNITYSKQPANKMKYKKSRRPPTRHFSSHKDQPQKQHRTEGSSSSQKPARGTSSSRY